MLVGGMVAFGAYKMSTRDAQRIEEHTGLPPEDLEDEDLEQAMAELGIEQQMVSEADQEVGGAAAPEPAPAAGGGTDVADQLQKLADLRDQGILTDEEFEAQKAKILGM